MVESLLTNVVWCDDECDFKGAHRMEFLQSLLRKPLPQGCKDNWELHGVSGVVNALIYLSITQPDLMKLITVTGECHGSVLM